MENFNQTKCLPVVAIVGTGNVATHLCHALCHSVKLYQVDPHTLEGLPEYADFVIISVKDSVIGDVAEKINCKFGIIAHTSGSVPMSVLAGCGSHYGVFYPLQTFTKGEHLCYSDIPFFIEGNFAETSASLCNLAGMISENVRTADSEARKILHLASVFACNFSNCLVGIADEILRKHGMDYRLLLPLLNQTVAKLSHLTPGEAQTGPAARLDLPVVNAHVKMLYDMGNHNWAEIYEDLSNEIIKSKNSDR